MEDGGCGLESVRPVSAGDNVSISAQNAVADRLSLGLALA